MSEWVFVLLWGGGGGGISNFTYCLLSLRRYDSEGRLTNMTYPTGMVTSLHREMERSINIDVESSSRDDDVTIVTNLSSVEASYTVVQGKAPGPRPPGPRPDREP